MNQGMLDHAARVVRRTLERANSGDEAAQAALLRFAASDALENALSRLAIAAGKCAPTLEEIKLGRGQFTSDAQALRFEIETVPNVLNQAAGRAVVVDMIAAKAMAGAVVERDGADETHDSGEFPRPPGSGALA